MPCTSCKYYKCENRLPIAAFFTNSPDGRVALEYLCSEKPQHHKLGGL